jgi:hypothetical protein
MKTEIINTILRRALIVSLLFNCGFIIEHGAGYAAVRTGLVQGRVQAPTVAFGGFDAAKEQQISMLGDALPMHLMTPPPDKSLPTPARKPQVRQ